MNQQKLNEILYLHKKWLDGEEGGKRADFRGADLREANFRGADLWRADLWRADLRGADFRGADLREANLRGAKLRGAKLQGADLDYSVWPLWCGGLHVKTDKRIMSQLAYHFCAQDCDDPEYIKARDAILWFANQFHRADECGILAPREEESKDD